MLDAGDGVLLTSEEEAEEETEAEEEEEAFPAVADEALSSTGKGTK